MTNCDMGGGRGTWTMLGVSASVLAAVYGIHLTLTTQFQILGKRGGGNGKQVLLVYPA